MSIVDPANGVPVYVLLVGSPAAIPFEFQYLLDLYWNVGRLHFDRPEDYTAYAEHVVAYETGATVPLKKRSAMFAVKNAGDRPTGLLHNQVALPLATGAGGVRPLADVQGFKLSALLGADATKERLAELLRGAGGAGVPLHRVARRRLRGRRPDAAREAGGDPVPGLAGVRAHQARAPVHRRRRTGRRQRSWPDPFPVRLLRRRLPEGGQLRAGQRQAAAAAHRRSDRRAAAAAPADQGRAGLAGPRRSGLELLVPEQPQCPAGAGDARRDGAAAQGAARRPGDRRLQHALGGARRRAAGIAEPARGVRRQLVSDAALANRYIARNDARNYIVIGDPAVQLRPDVMAQ